MVMTQLGDCKFMVMTQLGDCKFLYDSGEVFKEGKVITVGGEIRRIGLWKTYYRDGIVKKEGCYSDSCRDGVWTWKYPSGTIRERGEYVRSKKTGPWTEFFGCGCIKIVRIYKKGIEIESLFFCHVNRGCPSMLCESCLD